MNDQNIVVYENDTLYEILIEIADQFKFSIIKLNKKEISKSNISNNSNYLILTKKKILNLKNQIIISKLPISTFKLIEKLNIEFLKIKFDEQSEIKIGKYKINLNSREIMNDNLNLKLTEKEINSIIYLFNSKEPVKAQELQTKVWGYQSDLETHTVETHIYRLRKKIINIFGDNNFLISKKNGYQIR